MHDFAISSLLFYNFSILTVAAALAVIILRNPVHSVLCLILAFIGAFGLCILLGTEFLAYSLIIVYIGAVAILILFVVMMLDIKTTTLSQGFTRYVPLVVLLGAVLLYDLYCAISSFKGQALPAQEAVESLTNTEMLGMILYTDYFLPFQMAGFVLLVAMVGCIVLTLRARPNVRKQDVYKQLLRRRKDGVELQQPVSGAGVAIKRNFAAGEN